MACSVTVHSQDGVTVVAIAGELDVGSADLVAAAITDEVEPTTPTLVVFDLTGLSFCDSSGLRVLEESVRSGDALGTRSVLAGPTRPVRHVLRVSGLDDYFTVVGSVEQALGDGPGA